MLDAFDTLLVGVLDETQSNEKVDQTLALLQQALRTKQPTEQLGRAYLDGTCSCTSTRIRRWTGETGSRLE